MHSTELTAIVAASDLPAALVAAEAALSGGAGMDAAAALEAAQAAWAAFETTCRGAWRRYPGIRPTGAHGGEADPRAIQLFATLTYVAQAGLYSALELRERFTASPESGHWAVGEAARIEVLIAVLGHVVAGLDSGEIPAVGYGDAVIDVAKRVGAIVVG